MAEVHVHEDAKLTESGPRTPRAPAPPPWPTVATIPDGAAVLDLSTSLRFYKAHIPGAWWGVRSRLGDARRAIDVPLLVLTSDDGVLAKFAAPEAAGLFRKVAVFEGPLARPDGTGVERDDDARRRLVQALRP